SVPVFVVKIQENGLVVVIHFLNKRADIVEIPAAVFGVEKTFNKPLTVNFLAGIYFFVVFLDQGFISVVKALNEFIDLLYFPGKKSLELPFVMLSKQGRSAKEKRKEKDCLKFAVI